MAGLTDIGGGNKLFEVGDAVDSAQKIMSLADLSARIQRAPFDTRKAKAEAIIAEQDASPDALQARLTKQQADAASAWGAERRARADFTLKSLGSLPDVLGQSFEAGQMYVHQLTAAGTLPPGTTVAKSEKMPGTFSIMVPRGDGSISTLPVDPNRLASAKDREAIGAKYREEWGKVGTGWAQVADFYRDFKSNINVGSGASDHVAMFSVLKMLDRTTQVGQGQSAEFHKNIAGLRGTVQNMLDKSSDPNAPLFGKDGSRTRDSIIHAAEAIYASAKHDTLQTANFFATKLAPLTDNPEGVIQPYGGIGYDQAIGKKPIEDWYPGKKASPPGGDGASQNAGLKVPTRRLGPPKPVEAGVGRSSKASGAAPAVTTTTPTAPPKPLKLDDLMQNLFAPGGN